MRTTWEKTIIKPHSARSNRSGRQSISLRRDNKAEPKKIFSEEKVSKPDELKTEMQYILKEIIVNKRNFKKQIIEPEGKIISWTKPESEEYPSEPSEQEINAKMNNFHEEIMTSKDFIREESTCSIQKEMDVKKNEQETYLQHENSQQISEGNFDSEEKNLIWIGGLNGEDGKPITGTGTLVDPNGNPQNWKPKVLSNQRQSQLFEPIFDQNGNQVLGIDSLFDKSRNLITLQKLTLTKDKKPLQLSGLLVNTNGNVVQNKNGLFDINRNPITWNDPVTDTNGYPVAGTGTLFTANGTPISWTGRLFDSNGHPYLHEKPLIDTNGNHLIWTDACTDKYGKPIPGTGILKDKEGKIFSWIGAGSTINCSRSVKALTQFEAFDEEGRLCSMKGGLCDNKGNPIFGTGMISDAGTGKILSWTNQLFNSTGKPHLKGVQVVAENGSLIEGPENLRDSNGNPLVIEVAVSERSSQIVDDVPFLKQVNGEFVTSKTKIFDTKGNLVTWSQSLPDQDGKLIAGTGTLVSSNGTILSWTRPLSDSQGEPINENTKLFDRQGNEVQWKDGMKDKEGNLISGTGILVNSEGQQVSWLGGVISGNSSSTQINSSTTTTHSTKGQSKKRQRRKIELNESSTLDKDDPLLKLKKAIGARRRRTIPKFPDVLKITGCASIEETVDDEISEFSIEDGEVVEFSP